tara:strand:- start:1438 stop:2367 length:930 start_codon:yes stop_codon:yes gene_type:complete
MTLQIRIAIVGVGKIAIDQHLPAIKSNPNFELVALVSRSAAAGDVPVFASLDAAFAAGLSIDAVAICTPPGIRTEACRVASANGCAILIEKPPAATVSEALELRSMAEAAPVPIFATWHARFASKVVDAANWCRSHTLRAGRIDWLEDARKWHPGQDWLWRKGGFGVFDPGINALSILTALYPHEWGVSNTTFDVPANVDMPISAQFVLTAGEADIAVNFDFRQTPRETWALNLEATDGSTLELTEGGAAIAMNGGERIRSENLEYAAIYERFAHIVRCGESEFDVSPLRLTERAFATAHVKTVAPFIG